MDLVVVLGLVSVRLWGWSDVQNRNGDASFRQHQRGLSSDAIAAAGQDDQLARPVVGV